MFVNLAKSYRNVIRLTFLMFYVFDYLISLGTCTFGGHEHIHIRVHLPKIINEVHHKKKVFIHKIPIIHHTHEKIVAHDDHQQQHHFVSGGGAGDYNVNSVSNSGQFGGFNDFGYYGGHNYGHNYGNNGKNYLSGISGISGVGYSGGHYTDGGSEKYISSGREHLNVHGYDLGNIEGVINSYDRQKIHDSADGSILSSNHIGGSSYGHFNADDAGLLNSYASSAGNVGISSGNSAHLYGSEYDGSSSSSTDGVDFHGTNYAGTDSYGYDGRDNYNYDSYSPIVDSSYSNKFVSDGSSDEEHSYHK